MEKELKVKNIHTGKVSNYIIEFLEPNQQHPVYILTDIETGETSRWSKELFKEHHKLI